MDIHNVNADWNDLDGNIHWQIWNMLKIQFGFKLSVKSDIFRIFVVNVVLTKSFSNTHFDWLYTKFSYEFINNNFVSKLIGKNSSKLAKFSDSAKQAINATIKDPKSNIWKAKRITPKYVQWGGIENIMNNVGTDAYFEGLKTWK